MTGETHRLGGVLVTAVGYILLKRNGLLLPNVNEGLQMLVMYPAAYWGSTASDLDHHWDSAPSKDPLSWFINKILHLGTKFCSKAEEGGLHLVEKNPLYYSLKVFDARHRSWQTHSDLILGIFIFLLYSLLNGFGQGVENLTINASILSLILTGFTLGLIAHLVLDMLTPSGIWFVSFVGVNKLLSILTRHKVHLLPEKVKFVPSFSFFATDGAWEHIIRILLRVCNVFAIFLLFEVTFPEYSLDLVSWLTNNQIKI